MTTFFRMVAVRSKCFRSASAAPFALLCTVSHKAGKEEHALSSFALRVIALLCMVVDHVGLALFPSISAFRCVGRPAFPLYCFLLTQGYVHTRDRRAYARRLVLLALLSEIPFDLLIFGRMSSGMEQNALFSLLLGFTALCVADRYERETTKATLGVIAVFVVSMLSRVSYGWLGIALCLFFYKTQGSPTGQALCILSIESLYCLSLLLSGVERSWVLASLCAVFAAIPVYFYNGRSGLRYKPFTILFYASYPLHLAALVILRALRLVPPYFFG